MLTRRRDGRLLLGAICLAASVPLLWADAAGCAPGDLLAVRAASGRVRGADVRLLCGRLLRDPGRDRALAARHGHGALLLRHVRAGRVVRDLGDSASPATSSRAARRPRPGGGVARREALEPFRATGLRRRSSCCRCSASCCRSSCGPRRARSRATWTAPGVDARGVGMSDALRRDRRPRAIPDRAGPADAAHAGGRLPRLRRDARRCRWSACAACPGASARCSSSVQSLHLFYTKADEVVGSWMTRLGPRARDRGQRRATSPRWSRT